MSFNKLSIVIPCFNEAGNVEKLHHRIQHVFEGVDEGFSTEIIFVDDASRDDTVAVIQKIQAHKKTQKCDIRLIQHDQNAGQSAALWTGVRHAKHEMIATLDGDMQNDPMDLLSFWDRMHDKKESAVDLIIGHRQKRDDSWIKRISSRLANKIRQSLLKDNTPDTGCGTKLFRKSCYLSLPYFDHMHRYVPALFNRCGYHHISMPVSHQRRHAGISNYGFWDRLFAGIVDLYGVAWLIRRRHGAHGCESAIVSMPQKKSDFPKKNTQKEMAS